MTPIFRTVELDCSPNNAFHFFTDRMIGWWPKDYTWSGDKLVNLYIEPKKHGSCIEIGPSDFRVDWGSVTSVKEGEHIDFLWQIDAQRVPVPDPDHASQVRVSFEKINSGKTLMKLTHENIDRHGDRHEIYHDQMDSSKGWTLILENFATFCEKAV